MPPVPAHLQHVGGHVLDLLQQRLAHRVRSHVRGEVERAAEDRGRLQREGLDQAGQPSGERGHGLSAGARASQGPVEPRHRDERRPVARTGGLQQGRPRPLGEQEAVRQSGDGLVGVRDARPAQRQQAQVDAGYLAEGLGDTAAQFTVRPVVQRMGAFSVGGHAGHGQAPHGPAAAGERLSEGGAQVTTVVEHQGARLLVPGVGEDVHGGQGAQRDVRLSEGDGAGVPQAGPGGGEQLLEHRAHVADRAGLAEAEELLAFDHRVPAPHLGADLHLLEGVDAQVLLDVHVRFQHADVVAGLVRDDLAEDLLRLHRVDLRDVLDGPVEHAVIGHQLGQGRPVVLLRGDARGGGRPVGGGCLLRGLRDKGRLYGGERYGAGAERRSEPAVGRQWCHWCR